MLILGDCLDILPDVSSNSTRMFFMDLPYGTTKAKWDIPIDLDKLWPEIWRILVPNGVVVATTQMPFTAKLWASQEEYYRYEWIWEKTSATGHLNAKKMPMKAHENILIFYKNYQYIILRRLQDMLEKFQQLITKEIVKRVKLTEITKLLHTIQLNVILEMYSDFHQTNNEATITAIKSL